MTEQRSADYDASVVLHDWIKWEGEDEVDVFAFEAGNYCNGPRCQRCGQAFCHHCNPDCYAEPCPAATRPIPPAKTEGER